MILAGDLNVALDKELDRKSKTQSSLASKSVEEIKVFIDQEEWHDVWRTLNPNEFRFTWKHSKPLVMSRLDYFLVSQPLMNRIVESNILPNSISNHAFIDIQISLHEAIKGRRFWKINNSFLNKKKYLDEINKIIDLAQYRYENLDPGTKWEMTKMDIIEFSQF